MPTPSPSQQAPRPTPSGMAEQMSRQIHLQDLEERHHDLNDILHHRKRFLDEIRRMEKAHRNKGGARFEVEEEYLTSLGTVQDMLKRMEQELRGILREIAHVLEDE
ncbi:Hypothetical predicted protein [Lecanosticta acicola]|uniref:Uncharacterized protein n=1 Tax=Lecanosticta acicola TaxID=111012 RepID=A0AAI9ED19_9PEZI|nr:Hypothetical predicted protein [Lecanosticta acicola]